MLLESLDIREVVLFRCPCRPPYPKKSAGSKLEKSGEAVNRRGQAAARVGGMASMGEALIKASMGDACEVRRLVSGGADVNDADEQGGTPLMAASLYGHGEVVGMLLAAEATV